MILILIYIYRVNLIRCEIILWSASAQNGSEGYVKLLLTKTALSLVISFMSRSNENLLKRYHEPGRHWL